MRFRDRKWNGVLFPECEAGFWADATRKRKQEINRDSVRQEVSEYPQKEKEKYGTVVDMPAQATVDLVKQILRNGQDCAGILCDLGAEKVYAGRCLEVIVGRPLQ